MPDVIAVDAPAEWRACTRANREFFRAFGAPPPQGEGGVR